VTAICRLPCWDGRCGCGGCVHHCWYAARAAIPVRDGRGVHDAGRGGAAARANSRGRRIQAPICGTSSRGRIRRRLAIRLRPCHCLKKEEQTLETTLSKDGTTLAYATTAAIPNAAYHTLAGQDHLPDPAVVLPGPCGGTTGVRRLSETVACRTESHICNWDGELRPSAAGQAGCRDGDARASSGDLSLRRARARRRARVAGQLARRQRPAPVPLLDHLSGECRFRAEGDIRKEAAGASAKPIFVREPQLGHVQPAVEQGGLAPTRVTEEDPRLAVIDLAGGPAPHCVMARTWRAHRYPPPGGAAPAPRRSCAARRR